MRIYTTSLFWVIRRKSTSIFFDYANIIPHSLIVRKYAIYKISDYTQIVHGYYIHPTHILCSGLNYVNFKSSVAFNLTHFTPTCKLINYSNHLYTLYFFHEIHPHKHSKNHRGRRACNSLPSGSQAGLCSAGHFSFLPIKCPSFLLNTL